MDSFGHTGTVTPVFTTAIAFIHTPLSTNPHVRFMIDGRPYKFEVGQAYEINNQLTHSVMNKGAEDRITYSFDYLPPALKA